jgi:hypothetical protein
MFVNTTAKSGWLLQSTVAAAASKVSGVGQVVDVAVQELRQSEAELRHLKNLTQGLQDSSCGRDAEVALDTICALL